MQSFNFSHLLSFHLNQNNIIFCYAVPEKAESLTVQKSEADPRHLVVSFKIACDQNYRYSQPDMYHIMLKSGECLKNERLQDFQDTGNIVN